jgi:hypothetical protein
MSRFARVHDYGLSDLLEREDEVDPRVYLLCHIVSPQCDHAGSATVGGTPSVQLSLSAFLSASGVVYKCGMSAFRSDGSCTTIDVNNRCESSQPSLNTAPFVCSKWAGTIKLRPAMRRSTADAPPGPQKRERELHVKAAEEVRLRELAQCDRLCEREEGESPRPEEPHIARTRTGRKRSETKRTLGIHE